MSSYPDEKRAEPRTESHQSVRLKIDSADLTGACENISGVGVLFFTDDTLQVTVELEEADGRKVTRTGRLVRVQRMSLDNTGFAVEFDDA